MMSRVRWAGCWIVIACAFVACGKKQSSNRNQSAGDPTERSAARDATLKPFVCPTRGEVEFCGQRFPLDERSVVCHNAAEVTDLEPLACLTNLVGLVLATLPASDVSPLAKLPRLERLTLMDMPVTDISPLAGLTTLKQVKLLHLRVTDLSPLAQLEHVTWLELEDMPVEDLSPVANLKAIEYLMLTSLPIRDLGPIADLPRVRSLMLVTMSFDRVKVGPLPDLRPLASMPLEELYLDGSTVRDLLPVAEIRSLKLLSVAMVTAPKGQLEELRRRRPDLTLDGTPAKEALTPP